MTDLVLKNILAFSLLFILLVSCAPTPGSTRATAVRFSPQNSQEIVLSPFYLSNSSAIGDDHAWYMTRTVSAGQPIAGFIKPNQMVMDSFTQWIYGFELNPGKLLNIKGGSAVNADCQGSFSPQIQMTPDRHFTGTLIYSGFADDCSLVFDGLIPFEGTLDSSSGEMNVLFSFPPLNAAIGDKTLQIKGDMQLEFNAYRGRSQTFSGIANQEMVYESGVSFGLKNMRFEWDYSGEFQKVTVAGQIDYADQGTVRLTTESPLQISNTPGRIKSTMNATDGTIAYESHKRRLPFDGSLYFHGADQVWIRLLFPKPGFPGFFRIDGSDGLETRGTL